MHKSVLNSDYLSSVLKVYFPLEEEYDLLRTEYLNRIEERVLIRYKLAISNLTSLAHLSEATPTHHLFAIPIFLFTYSRIVYEDSLDTPLAWQIYVCNKFMNGVAINPKNLMPRTWLAPYGCCVVGKTSYTGNNIVIYQGCTLGGTKTDFPKFGSNIICFPNSVVTGNSSIGNNVIISAGTIINDCDIPDMSIVFNGKNSSRPDIVSLRSLNRFYQYFLNLES